MHGDIYPQWKKKNLKTVSKEMSKTFVLIWRSLFETEYIINGEDIQFQLKPHEQEILQTINKGDYKFLEMCDKVQQQIDILYEQTRQAQNIPDNVDSRAINEWLINIRKEDLRKMQATQNEN